MSESVKGDVLSLTEAPTTTPRYPCPSALVRHKQLFPYFVTMRLAQMHQ